MTQDNRDGPAVLVADDEALLRMYAAGILENHGYTVLEARDAETALEILRKRNDVRLLFTDIQMPGNIDGLDLARQVHAQWPNILLIVASGKTHPSPDEIPDDGRFISKPYAEQTLMGEVDELMAQHPRRAGQNKGGNAGR